MTNKTYCPLPWIHLGTHPNGLVNLCCEADTTSPAFSYNGNVKHTNLTKNKIIEIMNSDSFNNVRNQFLNNEEPTPCKKCFSNEKAGIKSKRQIELQNYPEFDLEWAQKNTKPDGSIDNHLVFVELRLGNFCNLKCVTCNPGSSNLWQKEYDSLSNKFNWIDKGLSSPNLYIRKDAFNWTEQQTFWDDLLANSSKIKTIYINGGEPTLNREHLNYLEQLIKLGLNDQIKLWYSINGTIVLDRMIDIWSKFKNVNICLSLDGVRERAEYLRYPCSWEKMVTNIYRLIQAGVNLSIVHTVSILNFLYIDEFQTWCDTNKLRVSYNYVTSPSYLALDIFPAHRYKDISNIVSSFPPEVASTISKKIVSNHSNDLRRFFLFVNELDQSRGTNWEEVFPRLETNLP